MFDKIRVGISSCLLGEPVRYDGQHKLDRYIRDTLGQYFEFVAVCPEVECGFPVPRDTFCLQGDHSPPRLVITKTGEDVTERMEKWALDRVNGLADEGLCGFIFKSGSPSSGMERVRVYSSSGMPRRVGQGIFARIYMDHFPLIPVEDEGRLNDLVLRDNFIERIFVMARWRRLVSAGGGLGPLVEFHTVHKLLLMSHSLEAYRSLGRLVAGGKGLDWGELKKTYEAELMKALKLKATVRKHVNVLHHIVGYFKKQLSSDEKSELLELIELYRAGCSTLVVPMTLLNHYVRKYGLDYLAGQVYMNPHPIELQLRNHA